MLRTKLVQWHKKENVLIQKSVAQSGTLAYGFSLSECIVRTMHVLFLSVILLSVKLHFINLRWKKKWIEMEENQRICNDFPWTTFAMHSRFEFDVTKNAHRVAQHKLLAVWFFIRVCDLICRIRCTGTHATKMHAQKSTAKLNFNLCSENNEYIYRLSLNFSGFDKFVTFLSSSPSPMWELTWPIRNTTSLHCTSEFKALEMSKMYICT